MFIFHICFICFQCRECGNDGELRRTVNPVFRVRGFESLHSHKIFYILYIF